jgi:hypothetical protein
MNFGLIAARIDGGRDSSTGSSKAELRLGIRDRLAEDSLLLGKYTSE